MDGEAFCAAPESLPGFNGKYVVKGPDGRMEISLKGSYAKRLPIPAGEMATFSSKDGTATTTTHSIPQNDRHLYRILSNS